MQLLDYYSLILTSVVLQPLQLHLLQRNDVLLVVLLLHDHNVAVHEDVVEQEELPGLRSLAAHLRQHALADQHTAGNGQRLAGAAEAVLHHGDAPCIRLTVDCSGRSVRWNQREWREWSATMTLGTNPQSSVVRVARLHELVHCPDVSVCRETAANQPNQPSDAFVQTSTQ